MVHIDVVIDYNKHFENLRWWLLPKSDSLIIQQLLKLPNSSRKSIKNFKCYLNKSRLKCNLETRIFKHVYQFMITLKEPHKIAKSTHHANHANHSKPPAKPCKTTRNYAKPYHPKLTKTLQNHAKTCETTQNNAKPHQTLQNYQEEPFKL